MADKKNLEFELKTMSRRVDFRSDSRVKSSLLFHALYCTLIELNRMNEELVDTMLNNGLLKFRNFEDGKIVTVSIEFKEVNADQCQEE
jgi:hypothetical protein